MKTLEGGFLGMCYRILCAPSLGIILTGKGVMRAAKGVVRAVRGYNSMYHEDKKF